MKETVDDLRVPVKKDDDREKNEIVNGKVRHTQAKPILIFFGIIFAVAVPDLPLLLHSLYFPALHSVSYRFRQNKTITTTERGKKSILIVIAAVFPTNSQ